MISTDTEKLNLAVKSRFFKLTKELPANESILCSFSCNFNGDINCAGTLFVGQRSVYFYSKMNHKTLLGKSTKLQLAFADFVTLDAISPLGLRVRVVRQKG